MFQRFDEVSWADPDGGDVEPLSGLVKDEVRFLSINHIPYVLIMI